MAFAAADGHTESSTHQITQALQAWSGGEQEALEKLAALVYKERHRAAHRYMARELPGHTLQTTAWKGVPWESAARALADEDAEKREQ